MPHTFSKFATRRFVRKLCLSSNEFSSHMEIVAQLVTRHKQVPLTDRHDRHRITTLPIPTSSDPLFAQKCECFDRLRAVSMPSFSIQEKSLSCSRGGKDKRVCTRSPVRHGTENGKPKLLAASCHFANVSRCLNRDKGERERDERTIDQL